MFFEVTFVDKVKCGKKTEELTTCKHPTLPLDPSCKACFVKNAGKIRMTDKNGSNLTLLNDSKALPERNLPCPCGSGKKFKKCCWL